MNTFYDNVSLAVCELKTELLKIYKKFQVEMKLFECTEDIESWRPIYVKGV